ncbi:39S ribosomal protein L16, mitochondrial [Copidosoma floridanum]|uniref:39S ribosomal protein L16, mitochondrial n=1 Tax=Copidosoma floridanum TaxID=29053 RepID=UPI0006C942BB|nr:39S ribosomal protein L16, mitochondrial [Copidosoma floridanum]
MIIHFILGNCRLAGLTIPRDVLGNTVQRAGLKYFPPPKKWDVEVPPDSRGKKLPIMPKTPVFLAPMRPFKMQKKLRLMRGPELVHNELLHKQYGVIALIGGRLKYNHFEVIRNTLNRKLPNKAFALYRIDAPWQPVTKKGQGQRMGGGKGAIDHYVTPVKAGRVIIEVGGPVEWPEVKEALREVALRMPFKAKAVSQKVLDIMAEDEKYLEENNENPYTMKYIIQNNFGGCHKWISPTDKFWFGKHR